MESTTKEKALVKLEQMNFKIGYPDKWRDFSSIDISEDNSLVRNVLNCLRHEAEYDRSFLYKETDKTLWFMNPHDVNAYYSPSFNEIVFPRVYYKNHFILKNIVLLLILVLLEQLLVMK